MNTSRQPESPADLLEWALTLKTDESGIEQGYEKPETGHHSGLKYGATNADGHPNHDAEPKGFDLSGYTSVTVNSLFVASRGSTGLPAPAFR